MKKIAMIGLLLPLLGVWGWAQRVDSHPQMIVYNGKVVTMDDASFESRVGTIAEAMAIWNGRVLATGSSTEIRKLAGPQTKVIDLKGRTVFPGLILTHDHPTDWAFQRPDGMTHVFPNDDVIIHRWMPNVPPKQQLALFEPMLLEAVSKAKPGQWILISFNWGLNYEWSIEQEPLFRASITKDYLDRLAPNNPVKIKAGAVFSTVNQKAIDELRLVHPTLDVMSESPDFAQPIEIWSKSGYGLNRPFEPDAMFKGKLPLLAQVLKAEMSLYPVYGVSAIASSVYAYNNLQALSYLDKRGEMPIRFAWGYPGPDWSTQALRYLSGMVGHGTDQLWLIGAFPAIGGGCMSIPPRAAQEGQVGGANLVACNLNPGSHERERLEQVIRNGMRIATLHTGGDRDIDNLMDAIQKASKEAGMSLEDIRSKRHTFDHGGGAPRPDQIPIMKNLGMMSSENNYLLWKQDGFQSGMMSTSYMANNYGTEYAAWVNPRNSMTKAGVPSSFEIDRPLHHKLWFFITKGMNREDEFGKVYGASERTDRIIQLKALTRWGAYYMLRENQMGSLEPGKFADFIVLDRDYLTVPEPEIANTKVLMTVVGGKVIHLPTSFAQEIGMQPVGATTWHDKLPEGWVKPGAGL